MAGRGKNYPLAARKNAAWRIAEANPQYRCRAVCNVQTRPDAGCGRGADTERSVLD
jgi:hypothetical protein